MPEADEYTRESQQQFQQIGESLSQVKKAMGSLMADMDVLCQASVEGRLSSRGDISHHQGEYGRIVQGVNQILDTLLAPIQGSAAVLHQVAEGDLTVAVTGHYQGDHAAMKESINTVLADLRASMAHCSERGRAGHGCRGLTAVGTRMGTSATETSAQGRE